MKEKKFRRRPIGEVIYRMMLLLEKLGIKSADTMAVRYVEWFYAIDRLRKIPKDKVE